MIQGVQPQLVSTPQLAASMGPGHKAQEGELLDSTAVVDVDPRAPQSSARYLKPLNRAEPLPAA